MCEGTTGVFSRSMILLCWLVTKNTKLITKLQSWLALGCKPYTLGRFCRSRITAWVFCLKDAGKLQRKQANSECCALFPFLKIDTKTIIVHFIIVDLYMEERSFSPTTNYLSYLKISLNFFGFSSSEKIRSDMMKINNCKSWTTTCICDDVVALNKNSRSVASYLQSTSKMPW